MKYTVTNDGWLDGTYRSKGELMELTPDQAKWLLRAGLIAPCDPTAAPVTATPPRDKPAPRRSKGDVD